MEVLTQVLNLLATGVTILGTILIAWGAVGVGLAIKDGQGMSMDNKVATIIGGAIVVAAGAFFRNIDTSGLG